MESENKKASAEESKDDIQSSASPEEPVDPPIYEYSCHPAARNKGITILTTIFLIVCVVLTWLISFSPFLTVLAVLILFGSMGGFYFPTRYYFYDDHFVVKTMVQALRKEWNLFRSYYPDKNGVLLSPFGHPSRLENFRGLYIKFAGNRDRVMEIVRSKIEFEDAK
ncbi:MAG: tripartite tricarboxylate transporter permease [FCB group bacterium]|nr:tripartite tricarboxylate transporter permease [FCB group bacterium]